MKCIFEQFLSATTIPSVALVSAPRTMPSYLKKPVFKQFYKYKPTATLYSTLGNTMLAIPHAPLFSKRQPKLIAKILCYTFRI